jgi:hypothetical protein
VLDRIIKIPIEGIDQTLVLSKSFEGQRMDEISSVLRHDDMDINASLNKGVC